MERLPYSVFGDVACDVSVCCVRFIVQACVKLIFKLLTRKGGNRWQISQRFLGGTSNKQKKTCNKGGAIRKNFRKCPELLDFVLQNCGFRIFMCVMRTHKSRISALSRKFCCVLNEMVGFCHELFKTMNC